MPDRVVPARPPGGPGSPLRPEDQASVSAQPRRALGPLLVAVAVVVAVAGWLPLHGHGNLIGFVGSPIAMAAAAYACQRIGATVMLARPVRAFWRQMGHASVILVVAGI